ncbi:MAG: hypothetical protein ACI4NM_02740 [Bullifex sp.]
MNVLYTAGLAAGVMVTLLVVMLIKKAVTGTWFRCEDKFDERQTAAKGKGYKIGFMTMICYFMVLMVVTMSDITLPMPFFIFLGIVISIVIFAIYCIFKGAYIGYNQNSRKVVMMLAAIMILNLIPSVEKIIHGADIIEKVCNVNLLCTVMLLAVIAATLIKNMIDKKEGDVS